MGPEPFDKLRTARVAGHRIHCKNVKICWPGINGCSGPSYWAAPSAARSPSVWSDSR